MNPQKELSRSWTQVFYFRRVFSFSLLMILRTYYKPYHGKGETISNYLSIHVYNNAEKCPKAPEGPYVPWQQNFPVAIYDLAVDRRGAWNFFNNLFVHFPSFFEGNSAWQYLVESMLRMYRRYLLVPSSCPPPSLGIIKKVRRETTVCNILRSSFSTGCFLKCGSLTDCSFPSSFSYISKGRERSLKPSNFHTVPV